jgi:hypothetical protein
VQMEEEGRRKSWPLLQAIITAETEIRQSYWKKGTGARNAKVHSQQV